MNIIPIFKVTYKISGAVFAMLTVLLAFVSFEEMGIRQVWIKVLILVSVPILSFLIACFLVLFIFRRNRIWKKGKNSVTACYGDLLTYAFKKRYKDSRIIVIPVNDTFDTIVEEPTEKIDRPLVTPTSLHGTWIKKYCSFFDIDSATLNERIQDSLKKRGFSGTVIKRDRGNNVRYSLGSVAIIDGPNKSVFYLIAISSFDDKNNAHVGKKTI